MREKTMVAVCIGLLCLGDHVGAETIPLADFPKDSPTNTAADVHITPHGPIDLPFISGGLEVLGSATPIEEDALAEHYYAANVAFDQPATRVTLDLLRVNNSGWDNPINVMAYDNGKRLKGIAFNASPLGDTTRVTIAAPSITSLKWAGDEWVFHPFVIQNLQVSFARSVGTPAVGSHSVGAAPAPEPAVLGIMAFAAAAVGLGRRRQSR